MDIVAVISFNDAFVLSAWSKANRVKGDDIVSGSMKRMQWNMAQLTDAISSSSSYRTEELDSLANMDGQEASVLDDMP